jgi:hypothetical protein
MFQAFEAAGQVTPPKQSAKQAVMSDARFVAKNIEDNELMMALCRRGAERGTDSRLKELADQMLSDHSGILYSMQQLASAGTGSSEGTAAVGSEDSEAQQAIRNLSGLGGEQFDTTWVASVLKIQQAKYDELTLAKQTVNNSQLKTAVTEAASVIRKQVTKLKSLQKALARAIIQRQKEEALKNKNNR